MKKKILILLLLIIAVASSALKAQDWWVVQLPHQGVAECMLDVGDGYVCLAKVIDESVEGYPLTLYKYSKTGELFNVTYPDAPSKLVALPPSKELIIVVVPALVPSFEL